MRGNTMKKWFKKHTKMIILAVLVIGFLTSSLVKSMEDIKEVSYTEFTKMVEEDKVDEVNIDLTASTFLFESDKKIYQTDNPKDENFKKNLLENDVEVSELSTSGGELLASLFGTFFSITIMVIAFKVISGSIGKSDKIKKHTKGEGIPNIDFTKVAGNEEAKEEMHYLVDFLKSPDKYKEKGAVLPKGAVFYGPPGTGKTLLAKAIAGEAKVPFFSANGSDFVEMYVGVGAKRVRTLFEDARKNAPCIVFIDEMDSIGQKRGGSNGNSEQQQTINALLGELDGFTGDEGIVVIGATNRLQDLDDALIRPGRFDKHIAINLPDKSDRKKILNVHAENKQFAEDVDFDELAKLTIGFSGADLHALLNESTILSVINEHEFITLQDVDDAYFKQVMKGHKKKNQKDRKNEELVVVAWHEAGHALLAKRVQKSEVPKVTILSSTNGAGGVTFITPSTNPLPSKEYMENRVKTLYAGRIAEYLLLGEEHLITSGASSDIEQATKIIRAMMNDYGMSEEFGMLNLSVLSGDKPTSDLLLAEASRISKRLYAETLVFMEENKDALQAIAEALLEKESLAEDELDFILDVFYSDVEPALAS